MYTIETDVKESDQTLYEKIAGLIEVKCNTTVNKTPKDLVKVCDVDFSLKIAFII